MQNLEYIWKTLERLKIDDRKLPDLLQILKERNS